MRSQAGVLTIVMSYSLYPEVLAPQQAAEVAQALSWTLDNAASLGGDPAEVSPCSTIPRPSIWGSKIRKSSEGALSKFLE